MTDDEAKLAGLLHACGRERDAARRNARTQAAAEAARAERLRDAATQTEVFLAGYACGLPEHGTARELVVTERLRLNAALALTPTFALADHDAALLARVQPVVEAARTHLAAARAWIDVDPDDPREIDLALALSTAAANLRAAIAAYDVVGSKEQP